MDFSHILPSFWNLLIFSAYLLVAAPLLKFLFAKWHVPGLSDLAASI